MEQVGATLVSARSPQHPHPTTDPSAERRSARSSTSACAHASIISSETRPASFPAERPPPRPATPGLTRRRRAPGCTPWRASSAAGTVRLPSLLTTTSNESADPGMVLMVTQPYRSTVAVNTTRPPDGCLPGRLMVGMSRRATHPGGHESRGTGEAQASDLRKLSRLGESNPRPTHYEGTDVRPSALYQHRPRGSRRSGR